MGYFVLKVCIKVMSGASTTELDNEFHTSTILLLTSESSASSRLV